MATDRRLRADLLETLRISPQRLSERVANVKRQHGPMNTEEGAYVLAHLNGMDLSKYLDRETVDRIREMVPRGGGAQPASPSASAPTPPARATRPVRVGTAAPAVNLLLPTAVSNDASRMAELYPRMYLLENSIRNVIQRVMTAKRGKDWWTTCVSREIQKRVQDRQDKEAKAPWHGKRGTHSIYYSDFSDLKNIIVKNWADFLDVLPSQPWITQRLEELEPARNTLAHHNPVPEKEQKRLDIYFDDWAALIAAKEAVIP